jgi:hypothetical protein
MLRLLALCERQWPEADGVSDDREHSPINNEGERGYTVAVIPWSNQTIPITAVRADRVLHAAQLEELTHAF